MSMNTTPRRGFGVPVMIPALTLLMLLGAGCSEKEATAPEEAAPAPQIVAPAAAPGEIPEPVAEPDEPQVATEPPAAAEPSDTAAAAVDGQKTYQTYCQACHAAGVAGAPKLGDKDAWVPRIAKGNDALLSSVKNGLNAMPPMGTCMSCSDADLQAAIAYMVEQGS